MKTPTTYEATLRVLINGKEWKAKTFEIVATNIAEATAGASKYALLDGMGVDIENETTGEITLTTTVRRIR